MTGVSLLFGILASSPKSSVALVPVDLCTGDPCVIANDFVVETSSFLDFGPTTALRFSPGVSVRVQNGSTVEFAAGSISIEAGARFFSDAPGSSLYFVANSESIDAGMSGAPARFVLRDSVELGFFAEGDCALNVKADVRGSNDEGGTFYVQSFGNIDFTGTVVADGSKDGEFNAGVVDFDATGNLSIDAKLRARGFGPDSGQVLMRGATVDVVGKVDVKPKVGYGGTIEVTAEAGDIVSLAKVDASGRRAADDDGGNNCGGGSVNMTAAGNIVLKQKIAAAGGGPGGCPGGRISVQAGGNVQQLAGASIRAHTPGFISLGGTVEIHATGDIELGQIDVGADNAGTIVATAGGTLDAAGHLEARSNGSGDAADGSINLTGVCGLNVATGTTIGAAGSRSSGGAVHLVTSGGPMTIAGKVAASSAVNLQYVTGFAPEITGLVTPAPMLIEVSTGSCQAN